MNTKRLRPTKIVKGNLDLWLSDVVGDAVKDAVAVGLPPTDAARILLHWAASAANQARWSASQWQDVTSAAVSL